MLTRSCYSEMFLLDMYFHDDDDDDDNLSMHIWQLYFGLLIFLGYMVFDTQEIIERAHYGDLDYVKHALTLFTDFVAVLVRILIIMVSWLLIYLIPALGISLLSLLVFWVVTLLEFYFSIAVKECFGKIWREEKKEEVLSFGVEMSYGPSSFACEHKCKLCLALIFF